MGMSETYAATATQTIPVLALAAALEYRASVALGRGYLLARLFGRKGWAFSEWQRAGPDS